MRKTKLNKLGLNNISLATALIGMVYCGAGMTDTRQSNSLNLQNNITVSGVSSGGYMANQFHVAHSDKVTGVGIISAGPYFCSQGNLVTAMGQCLADGTGLVNQDLTLALTRNSEDQFIAPLSNLNNDKIWLFHGELDTRVGLKVNDALYAQYQDFTEKNNIKYVTDKAFNHHLPTLSYGLDCAETAPPFMGNCNYDAAGELLSWIVDTQGKSDAKPVPKGALYTLPQATEIADKATGMAEKAWLYIPDTCANGNVCQLHISFHGCQQNTASIGTDYVRNGGFNPWADKLNLVILYPQIASGNAVNPLACWDWWGYSDSHFHTRSGLQIRAVKQLADSLISGDILLTRQTHKESEQ